MDIFEFDRDMKLIWLNAKSFSLPDPNIFKAAEFLSEVWRQKFLSIKNNIVVAMQLGKKTHRSRKKRSPRKRKRHKKQVRCQILEIKAAVTLTAIYL